VDDMQTLYNRIFTWSSLITPLFLGIIAGSAVSGHINTQSTDFLSSYIFSWLNFFSFSVGCFTVAICGFLAAIYLVDETNDEKFRLHFIKKVKHFSIAALSCGVLVFIAAYTDNIPLGKWIFGNAVGLTAIIAAGLSLILLWYLLSNSKTKLIRVLAGFQITMILLATTYVHYPNIVLLKNGGYLSLIEHQGHAKTIESLAWALIIGSIFILPALFYLIYSFQKRNTKPAKYGH
jgi:cytochrome bd ubiquinol oxidase subunit II